MYAYIITIIIIIVIDHEKMVSKRTSRIYPRWDVSIKVNEDIYDDFYVSVYDIIYQPNKYLNKEYSQMMEKLPLKDNATVLDIEPKPAIS